MYIQIFVVGVVGVVDYVNSGFFIFFQYYGYVGQGVGVGWFQVGVIVVEGDVIWYVQYDIVVILCYVDFGFLYFVVQFCFLYVYVVINVVVECCVGCCVNQCVFVVVMFGRGECVDVSVY